MRSYGHLLKRAGTEFAKNLIWMAVALGSLAAILVAATDLPLVGTRWPSSVSPWPSWRRS
jgi:hypothetical protein